MLRMHTRYRRKLVQARHRAAEPRIEKLLEEGHIKLSSVISKLHGVSGAGDAGRAGPPGSPTRPCWPSWRGAGMRSKIPLLEEALDCSFFTPAMAGLLRRMLDLADYYAAQVADLDAEITVLCAPFEAEIARLDEVHGIGRRTAGRRSSPRSG